MKRIYSSLAAIVVAASLTASIPSTAYAKRPTANARKQANRPNISYLTQHASNFNEPSLLESVIYVESRGNQNARSNTGASGLMQVMVTAPPAVASMIYSPTNRYDHFRLLFKRKMKKKKQRIQQRVGNYFTILGKVGNKAFDKWNESPTRTPERNILRVVYKTIRQGFNYHRKSVKPKYKINLRKLQRKRKETNKVLTSLAGKRDWVKFLARQPKEVKRFTVKSRKDPVLNVAVGDTLLAYFRSAYLGMPGGLGKALEAYNKGPRGKFNGKFASRVFKHQREKFGM